MLAPSKPFSLRDLVKVFLLEIYRNYERNWCVLDSQILLVCHTDEVEVGLSLSSLPSGETETKRHAAAE